MLDRRQLFATLAGGAAAGAFTALRAEVGAGSARQAVDLADWDAVRELFPLSPDWIHLASFLLVSHPRPVAEAVEALRRRLDADPVWLDEALFSGRADTPLVRAKAALARYVGGETSEICLTPNTTTGLALVYHGMRLAPGDEILTTEHDHYVHHESIRYAADRAGATVRRVALYDRGSSADAGECVERLERAIGPRTRAVGITWVHSSTGVKLPVRELAAAVARANRGRSESDRCRLVVDGVHGFGNQDMDAARLGADFFVAGAHKWLFAPRGTGFVWARAETWTSLRPTVPTFDMDGGEAYAAWIEQRPLGATTAAMVAPGGFVAYEHQLAIPAAVELHERIGRARIAARIAELNAAFREAAARVPGVVLHTPRDPDLAAGINCFEIPGLSAEQVVGRFAERRLRITASPYRISYPRVALGIMNTPQEVEQAVEELRRVAA